LARVLDLITSPEYLSIMLNQEQPVTPVFQTSLYADSGFGILGLVLERLTNQTYADAMQTHLAKPLDLSGSGSVEPPAEGLNALALPGNESVSNWGIDNPITSPYVL
jgi:CubicO group peptidase (beta-lactamase class C family)